MKRIHTVRPMMIFALASSLSPLIALSIVVPASAATTSSAPPAAASSWVYYPVGVHLSGVIQTTVQGSRSADGSCIISASGQGKGKAGGPARAVIEVGYDAATCQAKYDSGTLPSSTSIPSPNSTYPGYSTQVESGSIPATPTSQPDPAAYQDNQWLDPFGIQVDAQEQWINWSVSGGCDTYISWTTKWSTYPDGWYKNWSHNPGYANCSSAGSHPSSEMSNSYFCAAINLGAGTTTHVWFGDISGTVYGDHLVGYPNGSYYWSYNDSKSGGCNSMLHHGHIDS